MFRLFVLVFIIQVPLYAMAHVEKLGTANLTVSISALPNPINLTQGGKVWLDQAFLSTFSFEFYQCEKKAEEQKVSLISWLIPVANANHKIEFIKPTQVEVRTSHDLSKDTLLELSDIKLPVGQYCGLQYTLGHTGKKSTEKLIPDLGRYSFYVTGRLETASLNTSKNIKETVNYAYGKSIPISLNIDPNKEVNINIVLELEDVISKIDFVNLKNNSIGRLIFVPLLNSVIITIN